MEYGRLDVFWPDGRFETFALSTSSVSVGRSTGNTVALETDTISRYHFSITHDSEIIAITDLDSANGTFVDGVRLESNKTYSLMGGEEIQIGQLRIIYRSIDDIPTLPVSTVMDDTQRVERESAAFRLEVYGPEIAVPPGSHTFVELSVTHLGDHPQRYTARVSGLPDGWLKLNRPEFELNAQETGTILVNIKPFRSSDSVPGRYPLKVVVSAKEDPSNTLEAEVIAHILPFSGFGMALSATRVSSGEVFRLHIHNQGSMNLPLVITGRTPEDKLLFGISTPQVILAPGQRQVIQGEIRPKKARFFGAPQEYPFDLLVRSRDDAAFLAAIPARFVEKPVLPAWAAATVAGLSILVLLLVIAGAGLLLRLSTARLEVRAFDAQSTNLNAGQPLQLSWDVTGAQRLSVRIDGQTVRSDISPEISTLVLETDGYEGEVLVELIAERGDEFVSENVLVRIDALLRTAYFEVSPSPLVRNVVQAIDLRWQVEGAAFTQIAGLEAFTTTQIEPRYGTEVVLSGIAGVVTGGLDLRLIAESADGEKLEEFYPIEVIDPTCATVRDAVRFFALPDAASNVVSTLQRDAVLVVDRRDVSGSWIRAVLAGGVTGWGARTDLLCAETFSPDALLVEVISAGTTGTPPAVTPVPAGTGTPRPTSTPGPVPTVRP